VTTTINLQLLSGEQALITIDAFVVRFGYEPVNDRRLEFSPSGVAAVTSPMLPAVAGRVFQPTPRVSVFIPTVANPPVRVPFPPSKFAAFESWMDQHCWGWNREPNLVHGSYPSDTHGMVPDDCRVYRICASTLTAADDIAARIYAYVAEAFDQESVFIELDEKPTTLFTERAALVGGAR
jgi:hypothetical protein